MKIQKFIKQKDNRYKIKFEDYEDVIFYDDLIIKYNLLAHKEIDEEKLEEYIKENVELEAYYKSVKYINKKIRTEKEIKNYLYRLYDDSKIVNKTVDKLKENGYINAEKYIKAYINDKIHLTNDGPYKIQRNLLDLGFDKEMIDEYLWSIDQDIFYEKLVKLVDKRVRTNTHYNAMKLKEKICYDLSNLGYEKSSIIDVVNDSEIETPDDLILKEYLKIKRRYEKKYEGYDLEARIISALVTRGFNYNDAKDIVKNN